MVSRIRSCFSGGVAVPARGEAFSFIFEKDSGRSGSRGARRELRARTGGRRVVRERGRCEGLLRARTAMCLCVALSSKPPRARAHGLKRSRTRVRERVVLLVGGGAEGSSLRGRGEHRGRRGGGGLDAKCHALAPTARGISLACGRLVVGTGPRSDGGPHTPERARGENTGMQQGGGGLDANCHALATGAVHPSSRARVEAPSGKRKPRRVRRRANPQRVRLRHEEGSTVYQRSLSLGIQRAPGRTRAHARESRRVVSAHVAPLGCEGRARACMYTHTHTHYLVDPASSICLSQRLSHACLSTSRSYGETANGSINQLWFLRTVQSYLDNCGNSRANTCTRAPTRERQRARGRALLLDQNQSGGLVPLVQVW